MVQRQAQEEGRVRKEIIARIKPTRLKTRASKSARACKAKEDVKRISVYYIDGYVEK